MLISLGLYEPWTKEQLAALKQKSAPMVPYSSNQQTWFSLAPRDFDYSRIDPIRNSIVMACLNWITRNFPQARFEVFRSFGSSGRKKVEQAHPLSALLNNPNELYDGDCLWDATLVSYNIDGNAYWLKQRTRLGGPVERLWWLPHWMVNPVWKKESNSFYYEWMAEERKRIEPDDIVHFRNGTDPDNPLQGLSPLRAVLSEVLTDDEAARYTAALLRNMAIPGVVITPNGKVHLSPEKAEAIKQTYKAKFGGDKRGEAMILDFEASINTIGFSPEQMDFEVLRRVPETRISGALGIPAIVAGLASGISSMTKNDFEHAESFAFEQNLVPTWMRMSKIIRNKLLPEFETRPQVSCGFETSYVKALRENETEKQERARAALSNGAIRVNEFRELAGFDSTPEGEIYLIPSTHTATPVERVRALVEGTEQPAALPAVPVVPANGNGNGDKAQTVVIRLERNGHPTKAVEWEGLRLSREPNPLERQAVKGIHESQERGKKRIAVTLLEAREKLITEAVEELSEMRAGEFHTLVLDLPAFAVKRLRSQLFDLYRTGRSQVDAELEGQGKASFFGVQVKQDEAEEELDDLADVTLSRLVNDVQSRAVGQIASLVTLGVNASEIARRLKTALDEGSTAYAEQAASGAANRALGMGRADEMEVRSDEIKSYSYSAILDQNTCDPCSEEDGKEADDPEDLQPAPNPDCAGASQCRCFIVFTII